MGRLGAVVILLLALALIGNSAQAQTRTWDGGGGNAFWQTSGNWDGSNLPASGNTLVFGGNTRLVNTNNTAANTLFTGVTFNSGSGAFVIWGNAINLGGDIVNNDGDLQTINLNLTLTGNRAVNAASGNITLGGVISGIGFGLSKSGGNVLTLNGANDFSGNMTLTAGTLNIGNASALGSGTFVISGNGTFNNTSGSALTVANAFTLSGGSPTFTGTSDLTIGGTVTISGANRTITVSADTLTLNGAVGDLGQGRSLTKAGAGTLVLNEASTYSGGLIISAGTVILGNDNAAGSGTLTLTAGTIQGGGGTRTIGNNLSIGGNLTFSGSDLTFTDLFDQGAARVYTVNNTTEFSGAISGGDALTKSGTGTMILSGNNTIGAVTVNTGGALRVANNGALGTAGSGTTVNSGGALELIGGRTIGTEALSLNGTGVGNGGALRNISGNNSWAGTITLANVTGVHRINSDSGTLTIGGGITETGGNLKDLTFGGAGNVTVNGDITASGGDIRVVKDGSGTLTLAGANTYDVGTTINGGTVSISANGNLGDTDGGITFANGATLQTTGSTVTSARTITLNTGGGTLDLGVPLYLSGIISGGNGLVTGGNDLILNRASGNNNIGAITVTSGRLFAFNTNSIGGSSIAVQSGATLDFSVTGGATPLNTMTFASGGTLANRVGTLTVNTANVSLPTAGTMIFNNDDQPTTAITVNGNYPALTGDLVVQVGGGNADVGTVTFNGVVSGSGGLIKTSIGTLSLTAANTYNGATAVQEGAIQLSGGNNRLPTGTTVTLGNGATSGKLILGNAAGTSSQTLAGLTTSGLGTANAVVGGNASVSTLTLNIASGTTTYNGILGGAGANENNLALSKTGNGTLELANANTYTGGTTLSQGTISLGANTALGSGGFNFAGGTLAANSFSDSTIGALTLTGASILDLTGGVGSGSLTFTSGSGAGTLTILGWTGPIFGTGTDDHIFITANPGATFLSQISFDGYAPGAHWLGTGEIVPVPEPVNVAMGLFGLCAVCVGVARRYVKKRSSP